MTICAPSDYYNKKFQKFITNEQQNSANKWIYDLIYKEFEINTETIYLDRPSCYYVKIVILDHRNAFCCF